jgi:hypothetical protein
LARIDPKTPLSEPLGSSAAGAQTNLNARALLAVAWMYAGPLVGSPSSHVRFTWNQESLVSSIAGGTATTDTFDADRMFAFDVAPDGKLLVSRGKLINDVVMISHARKEYQAGHR